MSFRAHLDQPAGPPVVESPSPNSEGYLSRLGAPPDDAARTAALAEPHSVAWRLRTALPGVDLDLSEGKEPGAYENEVYHYLAVIE